jgi:hypothetical protein
MMWTEKQASKKCTNRIKIARRQQMVRGFVVGA